MMSPTISPVLMSHPHFWSASDSAATHDDSPRCGEVIGAISLEDKGWLCIAVVASVKELCPGLGVLRSRCGRNRNGVEDAKGPCVGHDRGEIVPKDGVDRESVVAVRVENGHLLRDDVAVKLLSSRSALHRGPGPVFQ